MRGDPRADSGLEPDREIVAMNRARRPTTGTRHVRPHLRGSESLEAPRRRWLERVVVLLVAGFSVTGVARAERVLGYRLDVPVRPAPVSVVGVEPGSVAAGLAPLIELDDVWTAREEALDEVARHNATSPGRPRVGVVRSLPRTSFVLERQGPAVDGDDRWRTVREPGGMVWATRLSVESASALRLRIAVRSLPPASQIWLVHGPGSDTARVSGPVSPKRADSRGEILLPPVSGSSLGIEIHVPQRGLSADANAAPVVVELVELVEVLDLEDPVLQRRVHDEMRSSRGGVPWEYCAVDGTCIGTGQVAAIDNLRQAAARIRYQEGGSYFGCSATLIADREGSGTPYLLTAAHCFSTQAAADTLIAYFDYHSESCDGPAPDLEEVPQVFGATLLAANEPGDSDVTLVRLSGLPTGEVHFMGWTTEDPPPGGLIHSLSHPVGRPQRYAAHASTCDGSSGSCGFGSPYRKYTATQFEGSTTSGSSGSGQILDEDGGLLIGQLTGFTPLMGIENVDKCDPETFLVVIGAFSFSHPLLEPWLGSPHQLFADGFESGDASLWSEAR